MSRKVFNMQGGRHSAAALSAFLSAAFDGDVAAGLNVEPTDTTGLKVLVKPGTGQIKTGQNFSRLIQIDADEEVAITAASPSNERHDLIVAYIDSKVTPTTTVIDNTNGVLKLASVAGTPSATPTDPTTATIQSKIGAGNPYIILARVTVPQMASSLTKSNITDLRSRVLIGNSSQIGNGIIESRNMSATARGDYSTDEVDTGVKYIDGRTVYEKTIKGSIFINANQDVYFDHGIVGMTDAFVVLSFTGSIVMGGVIGSSGLKCVIPHIEPNHRLGLSLVTKTQVRFAGSFTWGKSEFVLTLRYVK
jgi:hypothetical protein